MSIPSFRDAALQQKPVLLETFFTNAIDSKPGFDKVRNRDPSLPKLRSTDARAVCGHLYRFALYAVRSRNSLDGSGLFHEMPREGRPIVVA